MRVLFAALLFCLPLAPLASAEEIVPGMTMPNVSLLDRDGHERRLSEFRGRVIYLDFWASWCPPCLVSLPWMNEMETKYAARGLTIVGVNVDEVWSEAERVMKKIQPSFVVLKDPQGSFPSSLQIPVMPTSFLIDREGKVLFRHTGFRISDKEKLDEKINEALQSH